MSFAVSLWIDDVGAEYFATVLNRSVAAECRKRVVATATQVPLGHGLVVFPASALSASDVVAQHR